MTREELLELHRALCAEALGLMERKNVDYAGGPSAPPANLRAVEVLGVPGEIGVLTRCLGKFMRVRSFVTVGSLKVADETVKDSIVDVINYTVLLYGMILDRQGK